MFHRHHFIGLSFSSSPIWFPFPLLLPCFCLHTSSQNGKAKRKITTINNMIRTMLTHSSVPPSFWHHALHMAIYLLNILPCKTLQNQSPTQLLYHCDSTYTHLRAFGCLCYPLFPSPIVHKLQPRYTPCVFLGYPLNHRDYKCYDLSNRKLIKDETQFPFTKMHSPSSNSYHFLDNDLHPYLIHQWQNQVLPLINTLSSHVRCKTLNKSILQKKT